MAYDNRNAAYDLSLFDDTADYSSGSAAPKRREDEVHKKQTKKRAKSNVLTLPEKELEKNRRRRHNPLKLALGTVGGLAAALVIGIIIVGQVQLTELNQKIVTAQQTLEDAQSIYTQNQMKLEGSLSNADIEQYAEEVLGMTKATNAQKEFVTLSGGDKAEISSQQDENIFTRFIDSIINLWS